MPGIRVSISVVLPLPECPTMATTRISHARAEQPMPPRVRARRLEMRRNGRVGAPRRVRFGGGDTPYSQADSFSWYQLSAAAQIRA